MSVQRVFVVGATGYIGRHVVHELVARGHHVVCFARSRAGVGAAASEVDTKASLAGAEVRFGEVTDRDALAASVRGERFHAVISCLASRTGAPADAWRIDHQANLDVLAAVPGAEHLVMLSAICVQKPQLAFQHAKLAAERAWIQSGKTYSIVRPTAFMKSLSGQIPRILAGKPFMMFGDGTLTACKPIAEADLARFIVDCLDDPSRRNAILPIGGPGPAVTPQAQGELLFELSGREPKYRRVPVGMMDGIIGALSVAGRLVPRLAEKAELARIGRYYATESMLLLGADGQYDAAATPSFGRETLRDFYARVLADGLAGQELGDHAVF